MAIADEPTPVTKSLGSGTYTYVTSPDDTITSTFIGDCTDGSFGTSSQGYNSKGWVGGIPVSETDRFATNTAIIIGNGTTETKTGYVVGIGRRGYAATGNKSITVNANAHAGTIYAAYNLNKGHNSGLAVTGAESYYNNKTYFAPKADVGSEINVKLDGGSALQIYGGSAGLTTPISTEMAAAEAALGSKEAAEAYAAGNPAWALNEKIIISIINGKVGVTADGNVHSSIANDPTIAVITGGGMAGSAVNNEVAISVSGDSEVNGSIRAGSSAYDAAGGQTAKGFVNSTSVTISGGTVTGDVLGGGGKGGIVKNGTSITLSGGTVAGNVYGAGNGDNVLEGGTTITLSNDAKVGGIIHGGGYNGAVVTGDKTLNLGTEEEAYNGTIQAADFTDINMNNGDVTISSYTPSEEGTNLTVEKNSSLTINGDFSAGELKMNGGILRIIGGTLTADSVTLSDFSYEVYNPGYVGGGDNLNGFKQDSGRIAVGLDIGETLASVKDSDGVEYFYNGDLDRYVAPGATHWDIYYMNTSDHEAKASEIIEASKDAQGDALLQQIQMSAGTLGVNQSVYLMAAPATNENGEIAARPVINVSGDDTELSGMIDCATMHASGGKISATLHGDTSLTVTGDVEINGDSSQTGDTIITGPDAKLTIGTDTALGASTVKLQNQATLDLNHMAANNMIEVTGCTVANAEKYVGRMEVASHMTFVGPASAGCISLRDKGAITAESLRTTTLEALSDKGADRYSEHTIIGDVTINDSGAIILYSGKQITLTRGSLTLGNGVAMVLLDAGGEFAVGDILVTCISGTITGDFSELDFLVNNEQQEGYRVEISEDRKSVVLAEEDKPIDDPDEEEEDKPIVDPGEEEEDKPIVGPEEDEEDKPIVGPEEDEEDKPIVGPEDDEEDKPIVGPDVPVQPEPAPVFDQATADVLAQGNWGIVSASRAFVGAVQGQRNNMGCIANGRGTAWASLLGGMTDISGSGAAAGSDITLFGAAVGVDMKVGKRSSLGVAFGYTDGEVSADGLGDIDQEGGHIALYGEHGLKKFANNSCLSLDWVAATGTTESKYMGAKWEQDSVQLNTRLTWNKQVTDRFSYNVFGGLEYFASESDRVENCKSGSVQNLRGELGVGVRYVAGKGAQPITDGKCAPAPACERVVLYGEVSYINDMVRNNPSIEVNGLRGSGANPGRQGVGVEAGATIRLGEKWSASANYSFNAMDDANEHVLNIGASRTF